MSNLLAYVWDPGAWQQRRQRKLQALGKMECLLRVKEGTQDGLGHKWTSGIAVLHAGSLEFLPRLGGTRIPRLGQKWLRVTVSDANHADERTAQGREAWSVHPSLQIVMLRTPAAKLECAVTPAQRDWALARLRGNSLP